MKYKVVRFSNPNRLESYLNAASDLGWSVNSTGMDNNNWWAVLEKANPAPLQFDTPEYDYMEKK